jgi:hypothetical protein
MLEKNAREKRSSLKRNFVNFGQKKFYNIGPRRENCKNTFASESSVSELGWGTLKWSTGGGWKSQAKMKIFITVQRTSLLRHNYSQKRFVVLAVAFTFIKMAEY